jgi:hypothetical protein
VLLFAGLKQAGMVNVCVSMGAWFNTHAGE